MVLESIISPLRAEKKPLYLLLIGFVYALVSIFLSLWIFEEQASLISVFLIVICSVPLFYSTLKFEEEKDITILEERNILKEHSKALAFLIFLFCGIVLAYIVAYLFLPQAQISNLFSLQQTTITKINASAANMGILTKIFLNNIKVLTFCMIFSFFYGAGAIFILTWNGSVIATAMGSFIREHLSKYAGEIGLPAVANYFHGFSLGLLRYSLHGIPEIAAYFIASMAGGIFSVAISRHDFRTKKFENILFDVSNLILIAVAVLFLAALLETYLTPALFH